MSYPCIEAYVASGFEKIMGNSFDVCVSKGSDLKSELNLKGIIQNNISEESILCATEQMINAFNNIGITEPNLDDMSVDNKTVFDYQEKHYLQHSTYRLLSLLSIALMDLGLMIDDD